jgi:hypothetical protein
MRAVAAGTGATEGRTAMSLDAYAAAAGALSLARSRVAGLFAAVGDAAGRWREAQLNYGGEVLCGGTRPRSTCWSGPTASSCATPSRITRAAWLPRRTPTASWPKRSGAW